MRRDYLALKQKCFSIVTKTGSLQCVPRLYYSVDLRIHTYTEPVPLKYGKIATKYRKDIRIFLHRVVSRLPVTVAVAE